MIRFDSNYRAEPNFQKLEFVRNSFDTIQKFAIRLIRKVKNNSKNSWKLIWNSFESTPPLTWFRLIFWPIYMKWLNTWFFSNYAQVGNTESVLHLHINGICFCEGKGKDAARKNIGNWGKSSQWVVLDTIRKTPERRQNSFKSWFFFFKPNIRHKKIQSS